MEVKNNKLFRLYSDRREESNLLNNHGLQKLEIEKIRIRNELKRKAVETKKSKSNIIISEIKKFTDITSRLDNNRVIKRIVTRDRIKIVGFVIQKLHDILDTFRSYHQGNKFFLYGSGYDDQNRSLFGVRSTRKSYTKSRCCYY
jgi:hypothetical protein